MQALESDPDFRKKLEAAEADDIKVSLQICFLASAVKLFYLWFIE